MKLKGIHPIEQHIEKIVLAFVAVALFAVFALQFLTQPNRVDVGGRQVPPQNIYIELEGLAKSLDSQLKDGSPSLPAVAETDLVERYDHAFVQSADSTTALSVPLARGVDVNRALGTEISATASSEAVSPLVVPLTTTPVAASQWGTLDPYAVEAAPAYAAFVPDQQPFDFPSVSVEASFSGTALRDALLPADGAGIPRRFWQATGVAILGFEAQRQSLQPDGTWSQPQPIVTPPGTPTPTVAMGQESGLPELTEIVSNATGVLPEIARPAPPPTIAGVEWAPPTERVMAADDADLSEPERLKRRLARLEADLERAENPRGSDPAPSSGRTPGTGRTPGSTGSPDRPDANDRNRRRIEQLRADIEEVRKQLADLGESAAAPGAGATERPGARAEAPALFEQDAVQLWAHDLGVEPGETYRYRTRVVVNNPLFRKGGMLDESNETLQAAAEEPFARSEWSEWSEPVVVGAREYFFVAGADAGGVLGGGRPTASIEVYRLFYGHYRKSNLTLTPGDPVEASIRTPDGLYFIDTAVVEPKAAADLFAAAEPPGSLPAGISQATGRLDIDLGAYVLDVAVQPIPVMDAFGNPRTVTGVLLRDREGRVVSRTAWLDTSGPVYALVSRSEAASSDAALREPGQPVAGPASDLFKPPDAQP